MRCGRVALRLVGDHGRAEEIAAEAMTRAYVHWHKIEGVDYRTAWVLRVATNLAIDAVRRRPPPVPVSFAVEGEDDVAALRVTLAAALAALPRRQREVVVLRHLTGLSEPEIAAVTGLALGTVKTHLRRGMETLRGALGAQQGRTFFAV